MVETGVVQFIFEQVGTQGVWFALFLYVFYTGRKENKERENKLYTQLDKYNEHLNKNVETLDRLEKSFESLNNKVDVLQEAIRIK